MNLPPEFISNVQNTFREEGQVFLKALPDLIAVLSAWWGIEDETGWGYTSDFAEILADLK